MESEDYIIKWERELKETNDWIGNSRWIDLPKGLRMIIIRGIMATERDIKEEKKG
jgi:hypothetical protein